jgi:hypothetical protein
MSKISTTTYDLRRDATNPRSSLTSSGVMGKIKHGLQIAFAGAQINWVSGCIDRIALIK